MLSIHHPHPWDITPAAAAALQTTLASQVRQCPLRRTIRTVAGTDMSVRDGQLQAAVVVLSFPDLHVVDQATWRGTVTFPYVPGLLSFREVPALLHALNQLHVLPDLTLTDAQGLAHPRRFGLACHLGVLLNWPVIGVAKSRLVGTFTMPAEERGAVAPLLDRQQVVGTVVRTRTATRPVFVSVGHCVTLEDAVSWTLALTTHYRLPEPTRLAHLLSRRGG